MRCGYVGPTLLDMTNTAQTYTIETRSPATRNAWSTDGVGDDNSFPSEKAAEKAIEDLRRLGPDWADAEYRVVPE